MLSVFYFTLCRLVSDPAGVASSAQSLEPFLKPDLEPHESPRKRSLVNKLDDLKRGLRGSPIHRGIIMSPSLGGQLFTSSPLSRPSLTFDTKTFTRPSKKLSNSPMRLANVTYNATDDDDDDAKRLDSTFTKENATFTTSSDLYTTTKLCLNETFEIAKNSIALDDDLLSIGSEEGSGKQRLISVGDVKQIAKIQEESK